MANVCLILPVGSGRSPSTEWVGRCRAGLEQEGHAVEILAVHDPRDERPEDEVDGSLRWHTAGFVGLAPAVLSGLHEALVRNLGDYLVVLEPGQNYHPEDLGRLVEPLVEGTADLALAARQNDPRGLAWRLAGRVARPLVGASDLSAGLLALTSGLAESLVGAYRPVGSRYAIDLLLRSKGRKVEVPVRVEGPATTPGLRVDDLRHIKRLADDRFGTISRLFQFCVVGASGMAVDLTCYAIFQRIFAKTWLANQPAPITGGPLDLAAAGAVAIGLALTWNFSLNRRLTFNDARHGSRSIVRQFLTYALSNALGIALSFTLRLFLPAHFAFFNEHRLAAAVVGIVAATGISFSMSRWLVFGREPSVPTHQAEPIETRDALSVVSSGTR